jgi:hypothetical protein
VSLLLAAAVATLILTSCANDPSAAYFSTTPPSNGEPVVAAPKAVVVALPSSTATVTVAKPNPTLTPGAVSATNVVSVCSQPPSPTPTLSTAEQDAILTAYGININNGVLAVYQFDWLIPLDLGGANTEANIWPIDANKTIGYLQKDQLDGKLRSLVCNSRIQLVQTQQLLASDWYAMYLQYFGG